MPVRRFLAISLALTAAAAAGDLPSQKVLDRYKEMLAASPVEGTAFDRLWKAYAEAGRTAELLQEYAAQKTFPGELIYGYLLEKAEQPEDAAASFVQAATLDAKSPLPWLALGRLRASQGKHADSAAAFEHGLSLLDEKDPRLLDTLLSLGTEWLAAGNPGKASDAWERTAALDPENVDLHHRLAEAYVQNGLPDRALPHFEYLAANAAPGDRPRALEEIARLHQAAGRVDEAIRSLEQAINLTAPENWLRAELQDRLIRLYEHAHRTADLEARWKQAATENPRDLAAYLQLVAFYEKIGNQEQQRVWLEKLVTLSPKNAAARIKLGRLLAQIDQVEAAIPIYDRLLAEQPQNADLIFERATLDLRRNAPDAARRSIEAFLSAHAGDEAARTRALDFYERNRFRDLVEKQLAAEAERGGSDAITALANFYFQEHREPEARQQIGRLVHASDPPEAQAAAWMQVAQFYKRRNSPAGAVDAAEKAATFAGKVPPAQEREIRMFLGELDELAGRRTDAQQAYAFAARLSRTEADIVDADQKRFDALRPPAATPSSESEPHGKVEMTLPPPGGEPHEAPDPAMKRVIAELTREATTTPSAAAWLRVARWQLWIRNPHAAADCANKALALDPRSIASHEFLIKLAAIEPGSPLATWHLAKLAELDPANRVDYDRRSAQLQFQAGHADEALEALEVLARNHPGNPDVLNDLAQAQQRTDHWADALATWQRIYATAPNARKRDALASLIRAYDHLNMAQPAAELLLKEISLRQDPHEQMELFQELVGHCERCNLLPWLRERWEERRKRGGDDDFTELAYGRLLKAAGDRQGAFEALSNAALTAANPADSVPELVREAEALRRLDAAIALQEKLTLSAAGQSSSEALERLADLQEKAFRPNDATRTWEKIVAHFPRDAGALMRAVDFHLRSGNPDPAPALLRRLRELDPDNTRALLTLATLDAESGHAAEAKECLERIVALTQNAKLDGIHFPALKNEDASRLQTAYLSAVRQRGGKASEEAMQALRGFWTDNASPSRSDGDLRLEAIRELARLIRASGDAEALEKWIARWKRDAAARPSDALWALFYADAGEATLDVVEAILRREPGNEQTKQAFVWLGLQLHQYPRLGAWMRDPSRTTTERDFLVVALSQYLDANGGRVDPELVDGLFPEGARARLWQVAEAFGSRGQYQAAARLGDRAFTLPDPQRLLMGLELSKWHLCLGDAAGARHVLQQIASQKAESFESPVFAAIRDEWLLLPEAERAAFAQRIEHDLDVRPQPVHDTLAKLLFHGLSSDDAAARNDINTLLRMRVMDQTPGDDAGAPASRFWNFVLTTGILLETWKLDTQAIDLWEKALADRALIRLQGEQAQELAKEVRTRLFALKLAHADKQAIGGLLSAYAPPAQLENAIALGEALQNMGATTRALQVYRTLWEREPANPVFIRNVLSACRSVGETETAESILKTCLSQQATLSNESLFRELVLQQADLLEKRGAVEEAVAALRGSARNDPRLLVTLAEIQERAGRLRNAEDTWRELIGMDAAHTFARVALATLLQRQGKVAEALDALGKSTGNDALAKEAELLFEAGRLDDAVSAVERIPVGNQAPAVEELARLMLQKGALLPARSVLRETMSRITDSTTLMQMEQLLLETCQAPADRTIIIRELHKLRRLADGDPARLGLYFSFIQLHAAEFGIEQAAEKEMQAAWADGSGVLSAGAVLLAWALDRHDPSADALLDKLLTRSDLDEPWLHVLESSLRVANRLDLAARVQERLVELNPLDDDRIITWVRTLAGIGKNPEALAGLSKWSARAPLNDDFAGKVAQVYVELGAPDRAEPLFAQAIHGDSFNRNFQARLDFARLNVQHGNLPAARKLLAAAFSNPLNHSYADLAAYLIAAAKPQEIDAQLAAFRLAPKPVVETRRAIFQILASRPDPAPALAFFESHPEIATPATAASLREIAIKNGDFEPSVRILEKLHAQNSGVAIDAELAALLTAWAERELQADNRKSALQHLERAHELRPLAFETVRKLTELYKTQGDLPRAKTLVEQFLASVRDPKDRTQAELLRTSLASP